ncbi:MAG TPA: hypothetical protein VF273_05265 [Pelobium sp.]
MKKLAILNLLFLVILVSCKKNKLTQEPKPVEPPVKEDSIKTSTLIYAGANGKLIYGKYTNEGETNNVNSIPDFSFAGYKGGGVALPTIAVKKTLFAETGDCRALIQAAIDEVGNLTPDANGFRGAVLLKAGTYEVSNTLFISKSGVVLRGEGQGTTGTILKATRTAQHSLIMIKGSGSGLGEIAGSRKKITAPYVATGDLSMELESTAPFKVGDAISVLRTPNQTWIDDLLMAQYGWTASSYAINFERKISSINGNTITLNSAIVDPIQTKYGGGFVYKTNIAGRISECGVENMRLLSSYVNDDDENHGWDGVELSRAENCWVRQVTSQYFGYSCVTIGNQSAYNTVEECAMLDPKSETTGGRKYSFNLEGAASYNLFQRCYARGGRHDYVTGSRVPGPNVFLDSYAEQTNADIGPHHRWATGLLFDNIYGGEIRVRNRGASGSGHGWAGAQTVFWNCVSSSQTFEVSSPKGGKNFGIGCKATDKQGTGFWESYNVPVTPRSLYITQLKERLGQSAVNNIATAAQRNGTIINLIKNWKGEGKLLEM